MHAEPARADFLLPARVPARDVRRWFASGDARLAIDVPLETRADGAPEALHDAVLLGARDVPLGHLAALCDEDFAWRPLAPDAATTPPLDFTLGVQDARIAVALPDALRERLDATLAPNGATTVRDDAAAPSADAVSIVPHRPTLPLVLERTTLDAADRERLGVGAVLLLAGSFGTRWRGALGDGEGGFALPLELDPAGGVMTPLVAAVAPRATDGTRPAARDAAGTGCTVKLDGPIPVPLERWSSTTPDRTPLPLALGGGTAVTVRLDDAEGPRTFTGELLALRGGFGVRLADER